ncbi:hypothetical protein [Pseudochryseolinea flava]|uniref:Uncharacterized protein n=1 Tax=Pseudochryseolinea flava TaxID=2059302 RepID=A0A364Y5J7_9BACT|nr:hypothetical protein [Pseudochryseolinea flava]RAW01087.1 hypothetical protein DQQ10_12730 [Pseudochryseolinea flava]
MTKQPFDVNKFRAVHIGGWSLLWSIYQDNKPFHKSKIFWCSIAGTTVAFVTIIITEKEIFGVIEYLSAKIVEIMPDILGFNLGAYVLLIGLNSQSILDKITIAQKNSDFSLFQKMSSVFAVSILIQAIALIYGYGAQTVIEIGSDVKVTFLFAKWVNIVSFIGLAFFSFFSVVTIPQIIFNIFQFGQMLHYNIAIERMVRENAIVKSERPKKNKSSRKLKR